MDAKKEKMLIDLTRLKGLLGMKTKYVRYLKSMQAPYADKFLYDGLGSIIAKNVV